MFRCGHCKSAKPHLVAAAARLTETKGNKATIAAVDCTKYDALCNKFQVNGKLPLVIEQSLSK